MQRELAFPHSISAPNNFKQEQQKPNLRIGECTSEIYWLFKIIRLSTHIIKHRGWVTCNQVFAIDTWKLQQQLTQSLIQNSYFKESTNISEYGLYISNID